LTDQYTLPLEEDTKHTPAHDAERAKYLERLRQHLQDPDFRAIEGFPIGDDDAILALSDPPYYTACPNPFLPEIIERWQAERAQIREELGLPDDSADNGNDGPAIYHREPFASDVSEGKNNPIYNAHSYHTKVPHKAVMRYILHYTDPGDIVFDGFCGTGMTGVAAQLCGDRKAVQELGYRVDDDGVIYDGDEPISHLGTRKAVLVDLSPAATFIAYNLNAPVDAAVFGREAKRILQEVEDECGWMYETLHGDDEVKGRVNYAILSDVFLCPECGGEMVFWKVAVDEDTGKVRSDWSCPGCNVLLAKSPSKKSGALKVERVWETAYDLTLGQIARRAKQVPVRINYSMGKDRYEKTPDADDLALVRRIEETDIPYWFPTEKMMFKDGVWGEQWRQGYHEHITHIHQFYTKRNLLLSATIVHRIRALPTSPLRAALLFWFQSVALTFTSLNRYLKNAFSQVNRSRSGTLYIPALHSEVRPGYALQGKIRRLTQVFAKLSNLPYSAISTASAADLKLPDMSVDYVFVDPPFGGNLMYSELNFLWEAWLCVFTNNGPEAIVNKVQRKRLPEYQRLMERCFCEFYRVLKPGRWMTVEFHNSQNRVWNAIQEALLRAGFVVADVRTFDKKQGTFNQVTATGAVKQDLIISAYKPRTSFERRFQAQAGTPEGAWAFIRQHLAQLPVVVERDGSLEIVAERQSYLLFDRMVAFHIQRGATVPLSAAEFYAGLRERFVERDGMFFLPDQVPEYDRARLQAAEVAQLTLFVSDEKSSIQWLRQQLDSSTGGSPQTYQELQPQFLRQLHQARHEVLPELSEILEHNFLQDEAGRWYVPDPNKATDLEKLRQRALLREFAECTEGRGRLRKFRTEAVRAGFADAWHRRDYATIVKVAERLPERVLQEDPDLLMYYDNASLRVGA